MTDRLLITGLVGSILLAVCCFSPLLVWLLLALGLSALVGYLDFVLLPVLLTFLFILGFALWQRRRRS